MTGLVDAVKAKVSSECIVRRCGARGCSVSMTGAPRPNVLVNMDCRELPIGRGDTRCDFVFVSDDGDWVVALELKRGRLDASEIVGQLQAGAKFAEGIVPEDASVQFLPVAVHGGKTHKIEREQIRRAKIRFRNKQFNVKMLGCGRRLNDILK